MNMNTEMVRTLMAKLLEAVKKVSEASVRFGASAYEKEENQKKRSEELHAACGHLEGVVETVCAVLDTCDEVCGK